MKKFTPKGNVIKQLRENLNRLSTQKEMANEVGVSDRKYRMIENENSSIPMVTVDRLAKALGVHREAIIYSTGVPIVAAVNAAPASPSPPLDDEDKLIPRFDWDYARATTDEGRLYNKAVSSHDMSTVIETTLTEETSAYAEELFQVLGNLTWSKRDILADIAPTEEIAIRRRIRQLLVLLKGNDVWVYETSYYRMVPERYTLAPEGEPCTHQGRLVLALGPPGEYGEETLRVNIDNGQPFMLPSWKNLRSKNAGGDDAAK
ncbi:helix-turn-helix transcriptional regulator [Mesorhizobium sp. B2-7-1]|uniref:helix-turn-helix transcriptional regulator n=1 Tax=Mesorhizobium sp. B2-7-1 TaxID=2589909 RepID=UPI00112A590A|nr:helix-turn-helix transcriptional regulator [Mesorhizobium sp. B2-7-1]TPJ44459.1 helix-turn-helix transcriptional regulator [Mesorhizobium sp. B2-7-1]